MSNNDVVLEVRNLTKAYGAVWALRGVNLKLRAGEILGLVGDNGAGKSTLLKILIGAIPPTSGEIYLFNKRVLFKNPGEALKAGIGIVYQDPAIIEELTVIENFFIGRELKKSFGFIKILDWKAMYESTSKFIQSLGLNIDVNKKIKYLSGGERQLVTVARALYFKPKIVLLDEPTSALSERTKTRIFTILREYRDRYKASMIFVTHVLEDALRICDRIAIIRLGKIVHEFTVKEGITKEDIVKMIWKEEE